MTYPDDTRSRHDLAQRTLSTRLHQQIAVGTGVIAVSYGMARFGLGLAAPRMLEDGVVDRAGVSLGSSLSFATYVVACVVGGALLRRGQWRATTGACLACLVVGCTLVSTAGDAPMLLAGLGVAGAAAGLASGAVAYRLTRILPADWEPRGQAVANAGTGVGVVGAGALILLPGDWRTLFGAAAALGAFCCLAFALGCRDVGPTGPARPESPGGRRQLALPIVMTTLMGAGSAVCWTFGRSLVEGAAHLSQSASLLFWVAVGAAGVVGAISGDAAHRFGAHRSWTTGSLVLGVSVLLLPAATHLAAAILLGCLFGASYVVLCGLTIELARTAWPAAVGSGTCLLFAFIAVGQALGSLLVGVVVESTGLEPLFWAGGLVVAVSGVLARRLHST